MIDIAILRAMVAAGAPVEAILAAIETDQRVEIARVQARRLSDAERKRRKRAAESSGQDRNPADTPDADPALSSSYLLSSLSPKDSKKQEDKKERDRARKTSLPDAWEPNEAHRAKATRLGFSAAFIAQKADDMRNWAKSKGVMRVDWDATFHGFLRPGETGNGHGKPQRQSLVERGHELAQQARELERAAGIRREDDPLGSH